MFVVKKVNLCKQHSVFVAKALKYWEEHSWFVVKNQKFCKENTISFMKSLKLWERDLGFVEKSVRFCRYYSSFFCQMPKTLPTTCKLSKG